MADVKCDKDFGWIYPLVRKSLIRLSHFSLCACANYSRRFVDTYIATWISVEIAVLICSRLLPDSVWFLISIELLFGYRVFLDMLVVLLFSMVRHQNLKAEKADWSSRGRTVILSIINLLEIFVIFAAVYSLLPPGSLCPDIHGNPFNGLYFSVVTGITLGYGDIKPVVTQARILCIIQPVLILAIVLNMITFARGSHLEKTLEDRIRGEEK